MRNTLPETPAASPDYDLQACRKLMRGGSKSFFAASLLLPARVCAPASALYAFCRLADDAIDLGQDPAAEMAGLRRRLDAIYDGRPAAQDADRALAHVVHRFALPRLLLDALLEGFLWDATGRRYETLEEVQDYAARVAGTVGAMMALVMGAHTPRALARACELGIAMQLTNIARDVGEDARNGRLYLPRQWLREAGIDPDAWLRAPRFDTTIAGVVDRLLQTADALYRRAEHGVAELPRDCRSAILAARLVYAEIGVQLQRDGLDSVTRRTVVSKRRKLALIARAAGAALRPPPPLIGVPALAAVQFLVDAASEQPLAAAVLPVPAGPPRRSFDERMAVVIGLFERQAAQGRAYR
ncbi:MAG: phytoene/squalene synthase family protein [Burkholderiaceae bacterium]|jgi:phytoene synthase|nr:phytoene/squalene synthase family protein [Burkholderiaceae bacterium]